LIAAETGPVDKSRHRFESGRPVGFQPFRQAQGSRQACGRVDISHPRLTRARGEIVDARGYGIAAVAEPIPGRIGEKRRDDIFGERTLPCFHCEEGRGPVAMHEIDGGIEEQTSGMRRIDGRVPRAYHAAVGNTVEMQAFIAECSANHVHVVRVLLGVDVAGLRHRLAGFDRRLRAINRELPVGIVQVYGQERVRWCEDGRAAQFAAALETTRDDRDEIVAIGEPAFVAFVGVVGANPRPPFTHRAEQPAGVHPWATLVKENSAFALRRPCGTYAYDTDVDLTPVGGDMIQRSLQGGALQA
jgi:hypothetical protein